jgi:hypothetical protein
MSAGERAIPFAATTSSRIRSASVGELTSASVAIPGLRKYDLAIGALERACDNRETDLVFLKTWPFLDPLRDDPRF